jgi:hypothetical protein
MLPVLIRIRSEYFESDSSRYRLGITQNTIVASLKNQTDKNFLLCWSQCPMDPLWSARRKAFAEFTEGSVQVPRIEIEVGDDDFLCPDFVEKLRRIPLQKENCRLDFPNGYIFHDGKLRVWRSRPCVVTGQIIIDGTRHITRTIEAIPDPCWIYLRHQMNSSMIPAQQIAGNEINGLKWPGWNQNIVNRYAKIQVATATSDGCKLHPRRSKSVVIPRNAGGNRRR